MLTSIPYWAASARLYARSSTLKFLLQSARASANLASLTADARKSRLAWSLSRGSLQQGQLDRHPETANR